MRANTGKASWVMLLCAIALLAFPVKGMAESEWTRIDVTSNDEVTYFLQNREIWRLSDAYEPEEKVYSCDEDVRNIFLSKDALYLAYREGSDIHFAQQLHDRAIDDLFIVSGEADVLDFAVVDNVFIVLWSISAQDMYLPDGMYRLSAFSSSGERQSIGWEFASAIAACADDRLMLSYNDGGLYEIYEMDLSEGTQVQIPANECGGVFALAKAGDAVYFINNAGLNRLDPEGETETVCLEDFWIVPGLSAANDGIICFAMDVRDEEPIQFVYSADVLRETAEERTLTVMLNGNTGLKDDRMRRAVALLREAYPGVSVRFSEPTQEQLNTILMAGGEGADVVLLTAGYDQAQIDSGAFVDLREYPEVIASAQPVAYLLPLVTNARGAQYGIPVLVWTDGISENEQLAAHAVAGFDGGDCTWVELLAAALQFEGDRNGDQRPDVYFLSDFSTECPTWLKQYLAAYGDELQFDTPLFRELAERYRTALNEGKICDHFNSEWGTALYSVESMDGISTYADDLPMPALDADAPARYATVSAFAVNANSGNQDIALRFLQCYLDPHAVFDNGGLEHLRLDEAEYVDMAQFTEKEQQRIAEGRRRLSEAIAGRHSSQFIVACEQWMPQYYDGRITLDELIAGLQREWDMRRLG